MDKEKLILTLLEKLLWEEKTIISSKWESHFIWEYILLRCRNAWVHFWKLESIQDNIKYTLSNSRRIYYWRIKDNKWVSLSDLAKNGLDNDSKICAELPLIEITELEWAEIIPVDKNVIGEFQNIQVYIP